MGDGDEMQARGLVIKRRKEWKDGVLTEKQWDKITNKKQGVDTEPVGGFHQLELTLNLD